MVRGEVADDADAPGVGGTDQRDEGLVAAEQRVDVLEGARVVAVRALRGEHRRQVEHVRPERAQVVEVRLDAAQVSAEPLERRVGPRPVGSSSQSRGTAHSGGTTSRPDDAKRSGKTS